MKMEVNKTYIQFLQNTKWKIFPVKDVNDTYRNDKKKRRIAPSNYGIIHKTSVYQKHPHSFFSLLYNTGKIYTILLYRICICQYIHSHVYTCQQLQKLTCSKRIQKSHFLKKSSLLFKVYQK